ncbi:TBPIP-domain-containing protein [Dothidotthia symphoricarpi CBS 119687]|uniref:TBPIP-domain-containing protein n=1 Tax=Dothidotthia symphoricarpi CBS 119687 TaxID=1392245 RepID=A0A6A6ADN5_9PLEO|nr:TBPIP-domain-containing protein [Dothidotthia symphoricarpi CBS 119687]KAF2129949.1 TBPIP-domain-containing protein [Dothidotthia symphoricarpi CBS 119687]
MAPRKKTEEKASGNEAADMILHYLHMQNRPYSALEISANLHNKVTKRKQIVYHALQDASDSCTPEQLAALDTQISDLRAQTSVLVAATKSLRCTLASLNSTLSTASLVADVQALDTEKMKILARLDGLKAGKAKKVTQQEREEVEREWIKCGRVARMREKIAVGMWRFIEESVPDRERQEELRESMGLDE